MMSAFGYNAQESYVNLLGQWGQIIFLAYFGGRTVEKLADMKAKNQQEIDFALVQIDDIPSKVLASASSIPAKEKDQSEKTA